VTLDKPEHGSGEQPPDEVTEAAASLRVVTDARTMRALAHPVRIAILEELVVHGPLTATEVGERIGESPTTCSFHLRQLAKYGFVEEAGGGRGRARPWRVAITGLSTPALLDDPEARVAAGALGSLFRDRSLARYRRWLETRGSYPAGWQHAASDDQYVFFVTADELDSLGKELSNLLLHRYRERLTDPSLRPPDALPVELLLISFPTEPPAHDEPAGEQP
jgi:DNA-binding transcriptional ArsR family regulator